MSTGSSPATVEEMESLHGLWQPRLQNRCGDLLKISRSIFSTAVRRYEVEFLHKTVRDFLKDEYQENLRQRAPQDFDELLFLGKATLRLIGRFDCFELVEPRGNRPSVVACPAQAVIYAQAIQNRNTPQDDSVAQLSLMDGFERACEAAFLLAARFSIVLEANDSIPNKQDCQEDSDDMLEAAAKLNLYYYVKSKLERDPGRMKGSTYGLLHQALQAQYMKIIFQPKFRLLFLDGYARMMASEPDERIVGLLLDYKADPNQRLGTIGEGTPFTAFVERIKRKWRDWPVWKQERLFRVLKLLLQRGADPILKESELKTYQRVNAHDVGPDDTGEI
ncbi:hypothetical protein GE09DRAFT_4442 [Coniochaeta sp. 2T2.1]|nr:hypothetical protein GE09DRAFT_4442 [Coniochaeta sp. 2T2.1]